MRALFLLSLILATPAFADDHYDLIIRNARLIDGSGSPSARGSLAIRDGRIILAGDVPAGATAATVIDAGGKVCCPGFIDVHTHVDSDIFRSPPAENFVRDGVTTIVCGNCGGSVRDVAKYLQRVGEHGAGVNVATLYGHNTVLDAAKGDRKGDLTPEQMDKAKALVRKAMTDGAVGLSTGLIYNPGQFSPTAEIVELAKVAAEFHGVYATHMRNEGSQILTAIDEALTVARDAHIRTEISHFKLPADTAAKIGGARATLGAVERARAAGLDVWLDQYPYTASSTTISTLIPDQFLEAGIDAARKRVQDPAEFEKVLDAMVERYETRVHRKSMAYVVVASSRAFPQYNGKNGLQIAQMKKAEAAGNGELLTDGSAKPPEVTMRDQCRGLLEIFRGGNASCVFHTMNDAEVEDICRSPLVSIASDSGLRILGEGVPHPRGYGSNARVLARYAREKKLFPLEEAVRKMTSMPAHTFGFDDRGLLKPGCVADVILFDPVTVADLATFEDPHHYSVGITDVTVHGTPVLRDDKLTGSLPGVPIYGPGYKRNADQPQ